MQWDKKKLCMHQIQQKFQSSETFMAARPREITTESSFQPEKDFVPVFIT